VGCVAKWLRQAVEFVSDSVREPEDPVTQVPLRRPLQFRADVQDADSTTAYPARVQGGGVRNLGCFAAAPPSADASRPAFRLVTPPDRGAEARATTPGQGDRAMVSTLARHLFVVSAPAATNRRCRRSSLCGRVNGAST